jgi:predicted phosphodiesterase
MIAIFSDTHGNSPATKAVVEDIRSRGAEKLIFLGDALTGPDPRGTMDILSECGCIPVSGNVEQWIIQGDIYQVPDPEVELFKATREKMLWVTNNIGKDHLDWILTWADEHRENDAYFIHDTPSDRIRERRLRDNSDPEGYLYHAKGLREDSPETAFAENASIADDLGFSKVFFGHTHAPYIRAASGVTFCNVGSGAFCLDADARPVWVSLDGDKIQIHHVDYDLEETISLVRSGEYPLPEREAYVYMLRTGKHWRTYRRSGG